MTTKTRHLDTAIAMFKGGGATRKVSMDMRATYEQALRKQGWLLTDSYAGSSEWGRNGKRMKVENGDRVFISFDGITWKPLGMKAKRNILLASQS
jgi:hypothetical protein